MADLRLLYHRIPARTKELSGKRRKPSKKEKKTVDKAREEEYTK